MHIVYPMCSIRLCLYNPGVTHGEQNSHTKTISARQTEYSANIECIDKEEKERRKQKATKNIHTHIMKEYKSPLKGIFREADNKRISV